MAIELGQQKASVLVFNIGKCVTKIWSLQNLWIAHLQDYRTLEELNAWINGGLRSSNISPPASTEK